MKLQGASFLEVRSTASTCFYSRSMCWLVVFRPAQLPSLKLASFSAWILQTHLLFCVMCNLFCRTVIKHVLLADQPSPSRPAIGRPTAYNLNEELKKVLYLSNSKKDRVHVCADYAVFQMLCSVFHNYEVSMHILSFTYMCIFIFTKLKCSSISLIIWCTYVLLYSILFMIFLGFTKKRFSGKSS